MHRKQNSELLPEHNQFFLNSLSQQIKDCENDNTEKILLKITLINRNFLEILNKKSEVIEALQISERLIEEILVDHHIEAACYRSADSFFIILPNLKTLLNEFSFDVFKILQTYFISSTNSFFDFKLASIIFPRFGQTCNILLAKLASILQDQVRINADYLIQYNDQTNHIINQTLIDYSRANTLKKAISNQQIKFAFQPIVSRKSGHINHYECLLRIIDNDHLISAGPLIPTAEKLGFISIIDELVFDMVVEELEKSDDIHFAINISNLGVTNNYLIDKMKDILNNSALATRLIVEITETAMQDDLEKTKKFVKTIRNLGCKVAIDDFGAGYTSFRQLKLLPIDMIKIDGWFIRDVINNLDNKFFVKTLVRMAEELGAQTIAEFVENGEIAKFLLDIEVDYMQGNYFSPAIINRTWQKKIIKNC